MQIALSSAWIQDTREHLDADFVAPSLCWCWRMEAMAHCWARHRAMYASAKRAGSWWGGRWMHQDMGRRRALDVLRRVGTEASSSNKVYIEPRRLDEPSFTV